MVNSELSHTPNITSISTDFARFLGYFCGDGYIKSIRSIKRIKYKNYTSQMINEILSNTIIHFSTTRGVFINIKQKIAGILKPEMSNQFIK